MSQSELLKKVVAVLNGAGTPYMLTGSYASSLQGEPRLTHDIDLVVQLNAQSPAELSFAFPPPNYYLDEISVAEAIDRKSQFNLIDLTTGDKVDFWILTDEPFDQSRFIRRYIERYHGLSICVSRPEDTIIMKLRWAVMSGGSVKQIADAKSVFELQGSALDFPYIDRWVDAFGLKNLWKEIVKGADPNAYIARDMP